MRKILRFAEATRIDIRRGDKTHEMVQAPFSSYERVNIGHGTLIAIWATYGVTTLVFWTRMLVQIKFVKRLGIDDYLMLAAWVSITIPEAYNMIASNRLLRSFLTSRYRYYILYVVRSIQ